MAFIVTGKGADGIVAFEFDTAPLAYDKAQELEAAALESVVIIEEGRQYRPADFHRLVLGGDA